MYHFMPIVCPDMYFTIYKWQKKSTFPNKRSIISWTITHFLSQTRPLRGLLTKRKLKDVQGETWYDSTNPLESKFWFWEYKTTVHESHGQVFRGLWCYHNIDCIDHHTMPSVTFCNIDYCLSHDHSFPYYLFRNIINLWNIYPLCSPDSLMSRNSLEIRTLRGRAWEVLGRGMQPVTAGL